MITGVAKVVVSVDDQERAKQFWTGAIGFDAVMDESYGDERWIEVEAPDRSLVLVLSRRPSDEPRPHVPARCTRTCSSRARTSSRPTLSSVSEACASRRRPRKGSSAVDVRGLGGHAVRARTVGIARRTDRERHPRSR